MRTANDTTLLTKLVDRARTSSHIALVQLPRVQRALTATEGALGCSSHGITSVDLALDDTRVVRLSRVSNGRGSQTSRSNGKYF